MSETLWDKMIGFSALTASSAPCPSELEEEVILLFEQLRVPLLRYLFSFQISIPDAEEIAQEVFLSLFQHLRNGKSRANLKGWIFRVGHNLALRHRARDRRHAEHFSYPPSLAETAGDPGPGPEERMRFLQQQQRLLAIAGALPEQDQWCLSLRAEGLRYREIAEVLGISLGSVANSLERSLSRLATVGDY
jgi:RNA polymerase sigma-70 factor, ECF subfamily